MTGEGKQKPVAGPRRPRTVQPVIINNLTGTDPTLEGRQRRYLLEAINIIDRSGAVEFADSLTRTYGPTGKPLGRPRYFGNRQLLTTQLYTAMMSNSPKIQEVQRCTNELPDDCLAALGLVRDPNTCQAVTLSQVDHAWNRLVESCNASPVRDGKRLPKPPADTAPATDLSPSETAQDKRPSHHHKSIDRKYLRPELTDAEVSPTPSRKPSNRGAARTLAEEDAAKRRSNLEHLTALLLRATLPEGLRYLTLTIDWTDNETNARRYTSRRTSADPDARFGRRRRKSGLSVVKKAKTAKESKTSKEGKAGAETRPEPPRTTNNVTLDAEGFESDKDELFFGYNVHFAVGVGEVDGTTLPELAVAMRVTPANDMAGVAPTALYLIDEAVIGGHPVRTAILDLGYTMRKTETLHIPIAERDVSLVHDLEPLKRGRKGTHLDAVLINGIPHCPFTPSAVTNDQGDDIPLTPPGSRASREEWKAYWELRDQQDEFAFRPLGRRRPGTPQRYQCPALAGKVRCPFVESKSVSLDATDVELLMPDGQKPLQCCNKTFTAPPEMGVGIRQEPVHGSRDWVVSHDRRTAVERYNSHFKEFGLHKMDVRVLGIAKRTLALCFASMATNLHLAGLASSENTTSEAA